MRKQDLFSFLKSDRIVALKNNFESMIKKIVDYFSRREFINNALRCGISLAAVTWIHQFVHQNKEIKRQTDEDISLRIANFVILQSIFTGNVLLWDQFKKSIYWLGWKELELQIDPLQKSGILDRSVSKVLEKARGLIHTLIPMGSLPYPEATDSDGSKKRWWKALGRAFMIELIFRGFFQEILLRKVPEYLFATSRFISPQWVDSQIFQIARISLSSLVYVIVYSHNYNGLMKETISGACSGYLAEKAGFSFSVIQRFSEHYQKDIKNLPYIARVNKVHYLPNRATASCLF